MGEHEKTYIVWFVVLSNVLTAVLHHSTAAEAYTLHDIYNELPYIPLLVGGVAFGLRGAILAYLLSSTLQMYELGAKLILLSSAVEGRVRYEGVPAGISEEEFP